MKIEETNNGFQLFLNNVYFADVDWNMKSSIEKTIRKIFSLVRDHFKVQLRGFYKIKIYPNEIGTFMDVKQIDEENYDGSEIDFRVIVLFHKDMYLKIDDFYPFCQHYDTIFYQDHYYIYLDSIDRFLQVADFGVVVLDDEIDFNKCIFLNKKDYY